MTRAAFGGSLITLAINVWRYRELLGHLTVRSIRAQYKQSFLGYIWLFANPLAQAFTLTFVFSTLLRTPSQGVSFPIFLFAGLLPWLFFANSVITATESVAGSANLVSSVYFPRELLVVAGVLSRLADLLAGCCIMVVLLLINGQSVETTALWMPLIFVFHFLFTVGVSLPLAALNLFFHDVRFLVGVGLNLWFFFSPVMYPTDIVPEKYRFIYDLNPLARFITSYRGYLFEGEGPAAANIMVGILMAVGTLAIGYFIFKKLEPAFADRI